MGSSPQSSHFRRPAAAVFAAVAVSLLAAVALSSCAPKKEAVGLSPSGGGEEVIAAESFLADIVRNLVGDRLSVGTLVPPDTDPHEYQIRPADFARIRGAKLFVIAGAGYEAWLQSSSGALEGVDEFALFKADGSGDPHFWTDPRNTAAALPALALALGKISPKDADFFAAKATAYGKELRDLDGRIRAGFASLAPAKRLLLTNHDALGHFAEAYGFHVVGTVLPGSSTEAAPSARGLGDLISEIKALSVPAIFLDVGENRAVAESVAKETGVKVITDLYIEGTSGPDGPAPTYLAMLDHDAKVIADALR